MSEPVFLAISADLSEKLKCLVGREGTLRINSTVSEFVSRTTDATSIVLPASDARRLRDWLRERYPDEEEG